MKKVWKILSLVLVFALVMAPVVTLADTVSDAFSDVEAALPDGVSGTTTLVNNVIGVLQFAGYAIAIIMVLWVGVQWILATPSKKAELKGKMWSMAIGILLLVGGVTVIRIVWDIANTAKDSLAG